MPRVLDPPAAWLWARSPWVVPIPSFRTPAQVQQNAAAHDPVPLTADQMARIEAALDRQEATGGQEDQMPSPHMPPSPPELIDRFGLTLERFPQLERRKMFGYPAAFLASGHMVTGLHGASWIVRLGEAGADELRAAGGADFEPMPGRPMRGFLSLPTDIVADDDALAAWIWRAQAHAATLPAKKPKKKRV